MVLNARGARQRRRIVARGRQRFRNSLARGAAATLGFAAGNLPGAVIGYGLERGRQALTQTNHMAKRMRGKKSYKRKRTSTKRKSKKGTEATQYHAGVKRYKATAVRVKSKRADVKISPKFRSMVAKALHPHEGVGIYKLTHFGSSLAENVFALNQQVVWDGLFGVSDGVFHFTVDQLMNASAVLWNGGIQRGFNAAFQGPNFAQRWPESFNMKLEVLNAYSSYEITNTSLYTIHLKGILCKPKKKQSFDYNDTSKGWNFNTTTKAFTEATQSNPFRAPATEFVNCLIQDKGTESLATTDSGSFAACSINTLGILPSDSTTFKERYGSSTLVDITLQPGQTTNVFIQGPKMLTIDMEKCFHNYIYQNLDPKFTRSVLFIASVEQTRGVTSGGGFLADASTTAAIVMCRRDYYKFKCPDRAPELANKNVTVIDTTPNATVAVGVPERPTDESMGLP